MPPRSVFCKVCEHFMISGWSNKAKQRVLLPMIFKYSHQIGRLKFNCSVSCYQSVQGEFRFQLVFSIISNYLCSVLGQRIRDNPLFNNCHESWSQPHSQVLFLIACTSPPLVFDRWQLCRVPHWTDTFWPRPGLINYTLWFVGPGLAACCYSMVIRRWGLLLTCSKRNTEK